jgi:hypothetical protein
MYRNLTPAIFLVPLLIFSIISCSTDSSTSTIFEVRVENITSGPVATASNGSPVFAVLSPGVFVVHKLASPAYTIGAALPANGFEAFAEDTDSTSFTSFLSFADNITLFGLVNQIVDGTAGFIGPGESFRFVISASEIEEKLSAFFQYLESNDVVLGTDSDGIALFNAAGVPLSGDITARFALYDVGTEVNEEPGVGPNQPARQPEEGNTGPTEGGLVRPVDDGFTYPAVGVAFRITINPIGQADS